MAVRSDAVQRDGRRRQWAGSTAPGRARWAGIAAYMVAAFGAVAGGAAGATAVQEGATVFQIALPDVPMLDMTPPAPTDAQRAIAREAVRLALAHPRASHEADWQLGALLEQPRSALAGFDQMSSFVGLEVDRHARAGSVMQVALQLYLAGHDDALAELTAAVLQSRSRNTATARIALPVLLSQPLPPAAIVNNNIRAREAIWLVLAAKAGRAAWAGPVEPARPHLALLYRDLKSEMSSDLIEQQIRFAMVSWLVLAGRLTEAQQFVLTHDIPGAGLQYAGPREMVQLFDALGRAGQWQQLLTVVAASSRPCIDMFLDGDAANLAIHAGQRDALKVALRTALARAPGTVDQFRDLAGKLASHGFLELAEQELAVRRSARLRVAPSSPAMLAAAATVADDRPRLDRNWVALDRFTQGDTLRMAGLVVQAAFESQRAGADWRRRAVDWLGVSELELDRAIAAHAHILNPQIVRENPNLLVQVRRGEAFLSSPEGVNFERAAFFYDGDAGDFVLNPRPIYGASHRQLVSQGRDHVLAQIQNIYDYRLGEFMIPLVHAAVGWYGDPALLDQLLTIAEARAAGAAAGRAHRPTDAGESFLAADVPELCMVPVMALDQPEIPARAVDMLVRPGLFAADRFQGLCQMRAAHVLALRGRPEEALRVARAATDPAIRARALAYSLAAPLPPQLVAWHDAMRRRSPLRLW